MIENETRSKKGIIIPAIFFFILINTGISRGAITCSITTAPGTLSFSPIDPGSSANAMSNTATITLSCTGNGVWTLYDFGPACLSTGGLYDSGGTHRMRHTTDLTEFLTYSITITPSTGDRFVTSSTIQAVVLPANFQNALVGNYQDSLTITICP